MGKKIATEYFWYYARTVYRSTLVTTKRNHVLQICTYQKTAPLSNSLHAVLHYSTTKDDLISEARSLLLDVASEATKMSKFRIKISASALVGLQLITFQYLYQLLVLSSVHFNSAFFANISNIFSLNVFPS